MEIKPDFETILPDDCKQFDEVSQRYADLSPEDVDEAYRLMKESWAIAQRWSDIQSIARKIHSLSDRDFSVTAFKDWAHQRYRQMQLLHESTRSIWRQCNEYLMWDRKNQGR